jgi:integrase
MVLFQWHTGCRPGEVCSIRADEIDKTGEVWLYKPTYHKLAYRGKPRTIAIGKAGQEVLVPFLDRPGYLFSPAHAVELWQAEKRAKRKTPVQPSQVCRKKAAPKKQPGHRYETEQYNRAIARACKAAGLEPRHPNRLRHSFATRVRHAFGLEAAQVLLGHSSADITQTYAQRDLNLAIRVACQIG